MEGDVPCGLVPDDTLHKGTKVYDVRFPRAAKQPPCPFPGCPGSFHTWNGLRSHFSSHNWWDRIGILEEHSNPLPRRKRCGRLVPARILNTCHYAPDKCKQGEERRLRRETLQRCFEARRVSFQINTETLTPLEDFPYLGQTITYNNRNLTKVYQNLQKARRQ